MFELRWGILSTGSIATTFTKDLLIDPATRDVQDIKHTVVAVASRNEQKAREFVDYLKLPQSVKTYGSYAELYNDKVCSLLRILVDYSSRNAEYQLRLYRNASCSALRECKGCFGSWVQRFAGKAGYE